MKEQTKSDLQELLEANGYEHVENLKLTEGTISNFKPFELTDEAKRLRGSALFDYLDKQQKVLWIRPLSMRFTREERLDDVEEALKRDYVLCWASAYNGNEFLSDHVAEYKCRDPEVLLFYRGQLMPVKSSLKFSLWE